MNSVISTSVPTAAETKATSVIKATTMKTKTKMDIRTDDKAQVETLFLEAVSTDVGLLKIAGQPLSDILWSIEGAPSIGRIVNRSIRAFSRMGIEVSPIEWEDESGVVTLKDRSLHGSDLPILTEILFRLVSRACAPIGHTQHPLTLYDLKQSIGIIYDLKQEDKVIHETAKEVIEWMDTREMVVLEEIKASKPKATPKPKPKKAKKVNPTKQKPGKTANLANLQ